MTISKQIRTLISYNYYIVAYAGVHIMCAEKSNWISKVHVCGPVLRLQK